MRILSAAEAGASSAKLHGDMPRNNRPSCLVLADLPLARVGRPRRCDSARHQMQAGAPRVLCVNAMMGTCVSNRWLSTPSTRSVANTGEPGPDRIVRSNTPCAG